MLFLVHYSSRWDWGFVYAELDALLDLAGLPRRYHRRAAGVCLQQDPFLLVDLPSAEDARRVFDRSVLVRRVVALWHDRPMRTVHDAVAAAHAWRHPDKAAALADAALTWRVVIDTFGDHALASAVVPLRNHMRPCCEFAGPVRLRDKECRLSLVCLLDAGHNVAAPSGGLFPAAPPPRPAAGDALAEEADDDLWAAVAPREHARQPRGPAADEAASLFAASVAASGMRVAASGDWLLAPTPPADAPAGGGLSSPPPPTRPDAAGGSEGTSDEAAVSLCAQCGHACCSSAATRRVFIGVDLMCGRRALVDGLALKRRPYLGPTTLDPELALVMGNLARVRWEEQGGGGVAAHIT
jgi:hypothetical protein